MRQSLLLLLLAVLAAMCVDVASAAIVALPALSLPILGKTSDAAITPIETPTDAPNTPTVVPPSAPTTPTPVPVVLTSAQPAVPATSAPPIVLSSSVPVPVLPTSTPAPAPTPTRTSAIAPDSTSAKAPAKRTSSAAAAATETVVAPSAAEAVQKSSSSSSTTKTATVITATLAAIVAGGIAIAALGIYIFRKVTLSPSGDFRKRMMRHEYGSEGGPSSHGSAQRLTKPLSGGATAAEAAAVDSYGSAAEHPRRKFLMDLNEADVRAASPAPGGPHHYPPSEYLPAPALTAGRQEYAIYPYAAGSEYAPSSGYPTSITGYGTDPAYDQRFRPAAAPYPPPPASDYGGSTANYNLRPYGY